MSVPQAEIAPATRHSTAPPLATSSVATTRDLDGLSEEWDALADRIGATPFLRPGWIAAWWEAFGRGELEILTARRGESLQAVVPIAHRHGKDASPSNWHTPECGFLSIDGPSAAAVLSELFARRSRHVSLGVLRLAALAPEFAELGAIAAAARYRAVARSQGRSPYVDIQGEWSSYERALKGDFRRDLFRRRRRLQRLGRVRLDVAHTTASLADALALERLGWKGKKGTAISSRPETSQFYTRIARWAEERGSLRLSFLRLDGHAIAFHLALEEGGVYYALKGGFDPSFGAYAPGKLVVHGTLERAFATGLRRYELLGSDEDYKRPWATAARDLIVFEAFAPTLPGHVSQVALTCARQIHKRALATVQRTPLRAR
jgi:CelD/BcsL family acetyltransferase involved in cellulose biosynthesis